MARTLSKNDIPLLVLSVLSEQPSHGYSIAREVERRSQELFQLKEGTLYPVLRGLEQDELIAGEWQTLETGPARKVYKLTEKGQTELARRVTEWTAYQERINAFIGGKPNAPAY